MSESVTAGMEVDWSDVPLRALQTSPSETSFHSAQSYPPSIIPDAGGSSSAIRLTRTGPESNEQELNSGHEVVQSSFHRHLAQMFRKCNVDRTNVLIGIIGTSLVVYSLVAQMPISQEANKIAEIGNKIAAESLAFQKWQTCSNTKYANTTKCVKSNMRRSLYIASIENRDKNLIIYPRHGARQSPSSTLDTTNRWPFWSDRNEWDEHRALISCSSASRWQDDLCSSRRHKLFFRIEENDSPAEAEQHRPNHTGISSSCMQGMSKLLRTVWLWLKFLWRNLTLGFILSELLIFNLLEHAAKRRLEKLKRSRFSSNVRVPKDLFLLFSVILCLFAWIRFQPEVFGDRIWGAVLGIIITGYVWAEVASHRLRRSIPGDIDEEGLN